MVDSGGLHMVGVPSDLRVEIGKENTTEYGKWHLIWPEDAHWSECGVSGCEMLQDFLDLAAAASKHDGRESEALAGKVLELAQAYGPLMLCRHGQPYTHWLADRTPRHATAMTDPEGEKPTRGDARPLPQQSYRHAGLDVGVSHLMPDRDGEVGRCFPLRYEPLALWIRYAKLAEAVVKLAEALREGEKGEVEHWRRLGPLPGDEDEAREQVKKEAKRRMGDQDREHWLEAERKREWIKRSRTELTAELGIKLDPVNPVWLERVEEWLGVEPPANLRRLGFRVTGTDPSRSGKIGVPPVWWTGDR